MKAHIKYIDLTIKLNVLILKSNQIKLSDNAMSYALAFN